MQPRRRRHMRVIPVPVRFCSMVARSVTNNWTATRCKRNSMPARPRFFLLSSGACPNSLASTRKARQSNPIGGFVIKHQRCFGPRAVLQPPAPLKAPHLFRRILLPGRNLHDDPQNPPLVRLQRLQLQPLLIPKRRLKRLNRLLQQTIQRLAVPSTWTPPRSHRPPTNTFAAIAGTAPARRAHSDGPVSRRSPAAPQLAELSPVKAFPPSSRRFVRPYLPAEIPGPAQALPHRPMLPGYPVPPDQGNRYGKSASRSSTHLPAAMASTIMPTVTRMPRIQGLPPITSGLLEMRGSSCIWPHNST